MWWLVFSLARHGEHAALVKLRGGAKGGGGGGGTEGASAASLRELKSLLETLESRVVALASPAEGEGSGGATAERRGAGAGRVLGGRDVSGPDTSGAAVMVEPSAGDRVRVRAEVSRPRYEWGGVRRGAVGTLLRFSGDECIVDFPACRRWRGLLSELERVTAAEQVPHVSLPLPLTHHAGAQLLSWLSRRPLT